MAEIKSISFQKVHGCNYPKMPKENQTIADYYKLEEIIPHLHAINWYYRQPEDCPFARGNWIIDFEFIDGDILSNKFPKELTEEQFKLFVQPLVDKFLNNYKKDISDESTQ